MLFLSHFFNFRRTFKVESLIPDTRCVITLSFFRSIVLLPELLVCWLLCSLRFFRYMGGRLISFSPRIDGFVRQLKPRFLFFLPFLCASGVKTIGSYFLRADHERKFSLSKQVVFVCRMFRLCDRFRLKQHLKDSLLSVRNFDIN